MAGKTEKYVEVSTYTSEFGGLVIKQDDEYIFLDEPEDFPELTVGSKVPEEWSVTPTGETMQLDKEFYGL